ncbi:MULTISPECIES: hypothetical protein [Deinococcus]|uniref:DUF1573 domain-containing protein n=1 Tax=Deinococcus rufus TaxID=2136097 RepID=A0ABV7ZFW1_9DEIO|nr:hypothetical protein [Deinococcus sp. AB2017081]WQE93693.1 hypothetical protein U2P90_09750 [Deinococcus sp. AB2017081]
MLTAVLMSCTGATTEPTPVPTPTPVPAPSPTPTPLPTVTVAAQPDSLVFSSVKGQVSAVQRVTLQNTSTKAVQVTALTVSGTEFELVSPPALPFTLAVNQSLPVQVRLRATGAVGVVKAALQTQGAAVSVPLSGLRAVGLEGDAEPPLAQIVETLGFRVTVGTPPDPSKPLELGTGAAPIGDEIRAPLFVKAGTETVTLTPVARYSPDGATPFGYFTVSGTTATRKVTGTLVKGQYQTLNPAISGGTSTTSVTFDPGTAAFGIYIDPGAYNYPLTYTQDALNTGRTAHAVRVYPMKDSAGVAVANTYLLCFEPSVNGDYQDVVFVIRNVKPAP